MHAAIIKNKSIHYETADDPQISAGEILVSVQAAGINAADLMQTAGYYPPPSGTREDIAGLEYAGTVLEVGEAVTAFQPGDRVMGLTSGGAHATKLAIDSRLALRIPDGVSFPEAAGFSESFFTAYDALFVKARLQPHSRLLVTGAAGGVGMSAVQLGILKQCDVTASVRHQDLWKPLANYFLRYYPDASREKSTSENHVLRFSNDARLNICSPETETEHKGYDTILELVAGNRISGDLSMLNQNGTIAVIGLLGGSTSEIDLALLLEKRASVFGSTLRSRAVEEKAILSEQIGKELLPRLAAKDLFVVIDSKFALSKAKDAYDKFREGKKIGKIILVM